MSQEVKQGARQLEGVTFYNGEPTPIYSVGCPQCPAGMDARLQPVDDKYVCLECGCVFSTQDKEE
jgi:hypothetical protein